ncbi:hypothetical protein LINGRAHAP2_LOCUS22855 [Linum grandiflorum]
MGVNGLQNGSVLLPGQVLDVPLKGKGLVCIRINPMTS